MKTHKTKIANGWAISFDAIRPGCKHKTIPLMASGIKDLPNAIKEMNRLHLTTKAKNIKMCLFRSGKPVNGTELAYAEKITSV